MFIDMYHRHADPVVFNMACIGAIQTPPLSPVVKDELGIDRIGILVGVAILHRPVSRYLDDGVSVEISRLATDGTRNACSYLLGAAARLAFNEMGKLRLLTYTLASESGASLRGAGWTRQAYDRQIVWERGPDGIRRWAVEKTATGQGIKYEDVPFPARDWNRPGRARSRGTPAERWRWLKLAPAVFDRRTEDADGLTGAMRLGLAAYLNGVEKDKNPFRGDLDNPGLWSDWREGWDHGYYADLYPSLRSTS